MTTHHISDPRMVCLLTLPMDPQGWDQHQHPCLSPGEVVTNTKHTDLIRTVISTDRHVASLPNIQSVATALSQWSRIIRHQGEAPWALSAHILHAILVRRADIALPTHQKTFTHVDSRRQGYLVRNRVEIVYSLDQYLPQTTYMTQYRIELDKTRCLT